MKEHRLVGASLGLVLGLVIGCAEPPPEFPEGAFHSEGADPTSMNASDAATVEFADGKYFVSIDGVQLVEGSYTVSNDTLYTQDDAGPMACPNEQVGVYTWTAEGDTLHAARVEDPCEERAGTEMTLLPGPTPIADVVEPPETLRETWDRLWSGEFETDDPIAEFMTQDAVVEYGGNTYTGLEQIRPWAAEMNERGDVVQHFPFAFEESDGQITARARYTRATADAPDQVAGVGREVFTWVDENGKWKIQRAVIN